MLDEMTPESVLFCQVCGTAVPVVADGSAILRPHKQLAMHCTGSGTEGAMRPLRWTAEIYD
jgi:hypothetical protein